MQNSHNKRINIKEGIYIKRVYHSTGVFPSLFKFYGSNSAKISSIPITPTVWRQPKKPHTIHSEKIEHVLSSQSHFTFNLIYHVNALKNVLININKITSTHNCMINKRRQWREDSQEKRTLSTIDIARNTTLLTLYTKHY